jgi:plastocyanin
MLVSSLPTTEALMPARSLLAFSVLNLVACGGGDDGGAVDAPKADAQKATVMEVTCPAQPAVTFTTLASSFMPTSATISRGGIVKFDTSATHPVIPARDGVMTDPGIMVGESKTKCLMFTATGTFRFVCQQHDYLGTITVN